MVINTLEQLRFGPPSQRIGRELHSHEMIECGLDALPDDHAYGADPNEVRVHALPRCGTYRGPETSEGSPPLQVAGDF